MDKYILGVSTLVILLIFFMSMLVSNHHKKKELLKRLQEQFGQAPEEDDFEIESIEKPWKYGAKKDTVSFIDDLTWNDLDMDKVFARLNSCHTSLGEEYLYRILHEMADEQDLIRREKLIDFLDRNPELRLKLQVCLEKVGKRNYNGLYSLLSEAEGQSLRHPWIYRVLTVLPFSFFLLFPFHYQSAIICILAAFGINILVSYITRKKIEPQMPAVQYFSAVLGCCRKICKIPSGGLSSYQSRIRHNLSALRGLEKAVSGSMPVSYVANDTQMAAEYFRLILLQDIRSYNKLVRIAAAKREACLALCQELAELDTAIAVLSFRKSLPFTSKPHFIKTMQLNLQEVYHPLLQSPVPNSITLSRDTLITGSNASGKSTFIKAVAVNSILAVSINTCTARVYQAPKALVISSMAVRDNIASGDSYFIAEIKSLKRVLDHVKQEPCLCFIDEILKGTNTVERIAASSAVLKYLCRQNCICIAASHDMELTQLLERDYENYHFAEQITNNKIIFDYLIKPGPSKSKNAVKLLSYTKFDHEIVEDAETMVKNFERTGQWQ